MSINNKFKIKVSMKLGLDDEKFYGAGVSELLLKTQKLGSLSAASQNMNMSYSKALRITKTAEEALGYPLLEKSIGGANGGYSKLTERGIAFVEKFCNLEEQINKYSQNLFEELYSDFFD